MADVQLPIYLVATLVKGARAHWSLFVPNIDYADVALAAIATTSLILFDQKPSMEAVGKCLHALGQPMTGYNFAIEDNKTTSNMP